MNKAAVREHFLEQRKKISEAEYFHLNRQLCENFFFSVDLSFVKVVHTFLPMPARREVDTWMIVDRIRREFPHIRLSIPRVNKTTGELDNFFFEGLHQLVPDKWGIPEPRQGMPTEASRIDLVLVPLLAIDVRGHRVGYGKGYYDRFLASCRPDCITIGLSLFDPIDPIGDVNEYDVPLKKVITPTGLRAFAS